MDKKLQSGIRIINTKQGDVEWIDLGTDIGKKRFQEILNK